MKKVVALLIAVLLPYVGTVATHGQSEAWRKQPPRPGPSRPLKLPETREFNLANGATVVLVEDHRAPLVTFEVGIPLKLTWRASLVELTNEMTLAEATAELLTEGAGSRTSKQLAQQVESLGGRIASAATDDFVSVSGEVISENADAMLNIVGDVLKLPTFPPDEVALYKSNRIEKLRADRQEPEYLAEERFDRVVFGVSPYGITSPTDRAVRRLSRRSIEQFYKSRCSPSGAAIVIVGDFDKASMESKTRRVLSQWGVKDNALPSSRGLSPFSLPAARRIVLIDRPGSEQADIRIGGPAVARSSPDFFAFRVADAVLGGGTSSRLFMNIREKQGYAYDVSSNLNALKRAGAFFASSQTRTEVAVAAVKEMLAELARLGNEEVPADELTSAKNYLNGLFSLSLATHEGIAERLMGIKVYSLDQNYLEKYRSSVESVTADQVREVARKYIVPARAVIVVVGDASKLRKELGSIGRVEVFDSKGRPSK